MCCSTWNVSISLLLSIKVCKFAKSDSITVTTQFYNHTYPNKFTVFLQRWQIKIEQNLCVYKTPAHKYTAILLFCRYPFKRNTCQQKQIPRGVGKHQQNQWRHIGHGEHEEQSNSRHFTRECWGGRCHDGCCGGRSCLTSGKSPFCKGMLGREEPWWLLRRT